MDKNLSINIDSGTIFKTIVFIGLALLLYVLRDVVMVILAAIVISAAIDPGVTWFERRKIPRALGVIAIYGFLVILVLGILLFVIPTFLSETSSVVENLPKYIDQIGNIIPLLDQSILEGYIPLIQQVSLEIKNLAVSGSWTGTSGVGSNILETARNVGTEGLNVLIIVVLSFYLTVTRDSTENFLRIITPAKYESYILKLWAGAKHKMGGWLQGQLILGLLVGSLIYPVLAILGVKHALLLAVLAAFLELIPVFGPILATVPAVMLALLDGGLALGLIVLLYYIIVLQFENHVFYPLVVKKIIGISPLMVIISLIIGAKLAGIWGIILSVPVSVILMEYLEDVDKRKNTARNS